MNTFEVAVLRVLIKRQQPMKLSTLVSGFPDDTEDNVLSAVSSLKLSGYLVLDDYQPNGYVSVDRGRRKEILQIIDPDIRFQEFENPHTKEKDTVPVSGKKSPHQVIARHKISAGNKTMAVTSVLIVGLVITIGISIIPVATSPDSEPIAYHGYIAHNRWESADGADDHQGDRISGAGYPTVSPTFVALKDCNQKSFHHEQT